MPDETQLVTFACEECGQSVTLPADRRGHVEVCPHCAAHVDVPQRSDGSPPEPPAPQSVGRSTAQLWFELSGVLCLAYVPWVYSAIIHYARLAGTPTTTTSPIGWLVDSAAVVVPLLVIMAWSGDPWRRFGIVRPRWIADPLLGCAICGVTLVAYLIAGSIVPESMFEKSTALHAASRVLPGTAAGFALYAVRVLAMTFSEELVMRSYLIPRLERLLRSTFAAILFSAILFGSYHVYQGAGYALLAVVIGAGFAVSFCLFRRLWPVWIAHIIWNMIPW